MQLMTIQTLQLLPSAVEILIYILGEDHSFMRFFVIYYSNACYYAPAANKRRH